MLLFVGASIGSWIGVKLTYKIARYCIYALGSVVVFLMAMRQIYNLVHHSFANSYNFKIDLSQSILGRVVEENYITYTFICIALVIIMAFFSEKFMQKWYEKRKEGKKL